MSWCPIFPQITDSSIWELPPHVFKAWINILTKKNHETHIWRGNEYTLAREAKITVPLAKEALGLLASPDPGSLTREHDGKRILSDDEEHWWVVNGQKYQDMIKREIALENARQRTAKWRVNLKAKSSTGNSGVPEASENPVAAPPSSKEGPSDPIPETTKRYETARPILAYFNEKAVRSYEETGNNLGKIGARLKEVGDDADGVKRMIDRQVLLWKNDPKMHQYLTVDTLFGPENFQKYWGSRNADLPQSAKPKPFAV